MSTLGHVSKSCHVQWKLSLDKSFPNPFIALNIDGSVQGNPGFAVGRGVLKDSLRNWINGFSMHIGFVTNNPAELWVARQGLLIA